MESKYNMNIDDNIFFAKRKLVDNVYRSAKLEGIAVTFAQTEVYHLNLQVLINKNWWIFMKVIILKKLNNFCLIIV